MKEFILPDESIRQSYKRLVNDIDELVKEKISHYFDGKLKCGPACTECCIQFSVLPLEAALISAALLGKKDQLPGHDRKCALLLDELCAIYPARPLICRTQGLPIGYIDEGEENIHVSACHLNFSDDYPFMYEELLLMDQFNAVLAELNEKYCAAAGLNPRQRITIAELLRCGVGQ